MVGGLVGAWCSSPLNSELVYLYRDEFTTDDAAPIATPRACEPGPGTSAFEVTDAWSISGGILNGYRPATPNVFAYHITDAVTRVSGVGFITRNKDTAAAYNRFGWDVDNSGAVVLAGASRRYSNEIRPETQVVGLTITAANYQLLSQVFRSKGFFNLCHNGTNWLLDFVSFTNTTTPCYFGLNNDSGGATNLYVDWVRIMQLGSPFADDYSLATSRTASPANGATITHEANGHIEFTWTPAAGETLELDLRRTDADNRWIIRCDQAGSTIKLIQREGGVETERSSAAMTWTAGTARRIYAIFQATKIYTFVAEVAKNTYTSATFNQTATGGKVAGFSTGTELVAWPWTLSGAPVTELDKWTA